MMKQGWIIFGMILSVCVNLTAQPLIGLDKEEVRVFMEKERKDFRIDKSIVRQQFNYLKYVNNKQTMTYIIYFSDGDICTGTKLICDYDEYDDVRRQLQEQKKRVGKSSWEYTHNGKIYIVSLEKEEWYFILKEQEKFR
ncbi:MAG: hypothetical protein JXR52_02695 [Bacteroidales bacterium]|nr:hypothetical protein [Bacteroidales bacterium]